MKAKLKDALKVAMKAQDKIALSVIRGALSAIQYEEMQKGTEDLSADAIVAILKNEVKKRKESIEYSVKANRDTEVEALNAEIKVLDQFLPSQISGAELEKIISDVVAQTASANLGLVMKSLKDKYFGQYDSKEASELAKKLVG